MADQAAKFSFQLIPGKNLSSLDTKEIDNLLMKWSLKGRMNAQTYSFDQQFQAYMKDDFVLDFMKDPNVVSTLQVLSSSGQFVSIGIKPESVTAEPVSSSVISMSFFDRLYDGKIVRESGHICKCFDEFYEDFTISDELRKCLLLEESDNYDTFNEAERDEFVFRLFKHLCLGGAVCQYEDEMQPYLDTAKLLYKDLISVQKDAGAGDLHVTSVVFKITASNESGMYYPADEPHEQTFSYLIVDPLKRHVTVFYHKFGGGIF